MTIDAAELHGAIAAVVTPFTQSEDLDLVGLRAIVRHVIDGGAHGVMTTGGTGEFPSLSRDEKREVIGAAVSEAAGRVPVVAGSAACSTRETLELCRDAHDAGADAVIVTAPYYFPLPQRSLFEHYRAVAEASPIPVVVYNNPLYTGNNLEPGIILSLLELPGVVGIKQSNADLGQLVEILSRAPAGVSICTGIDSQFYPALCVGAHGIYSTATAIIPRIMASIFEDHQAGNHDRARAVHLEVQPLNQFLEYEPGYVAPCKEALRMLGLPGGFVRRPLPELTPDERERLHAALAGLNLQVGAAVA